MAPTLDDFYHLSRMALVKDETLFDRYDQALRRVLQRHRRQPARPDKDIPLDWLDQAVRDAR